MDFGAQVTPLSHVWTLLSCSLFAQQFLLLLREAEPRCSRVYLHVLSTNSSALSLYAGAGFEVHEKLTDHYNIRGELFDALKLVKHYRNKREALPNWCTIM